MYVQGGVKPIVKNLFDFKDITDLEVLKAERDSISIVLARKELEVSELNKRLNKSLKSIKKTDKLIKDEIPKFYDSRYIIADSSSLDNVIKHLRGAKPAPRDDYIRDSLYNRLRK